MGKLEKDIERPASRRILEELRVPNLKLLHDGGETGWPDRLYILPQGEIQFIEYKVPGEGPSARQLYIKDLLEGLGHGVEICYSQEDAYNIIRKRLEAA